MAFIVFYYHLTIIYFDVLGIFCASARPDAGKKLLYRHGYEFLISPVPLPVIPVNSHHLIHSSLHPKYRDENSFFESYSSLSHPLLRV